MKSGKQVGGYSAIGHGTTNGCYAVKIPFTRVLSIHALQHGIGARLYRQMYVLAYIGVTGHRGDYLIAHILGMARCKSHSHIGSGLGHHCEQCGKVDRNAVRACIVVGIHILAKQRHLLESAFTQIGQFAQYAFSLAAALTASGIGHYAVGAEVVASAHDADEARHSVAGNLHRYYVTVGFGCGKFYIYSLLTRLHRCKQRRQVEIGIRAGHKIHSVVFDKVILNALGHAAYNAHRQASVTLTLQ